MADGVPVGVAGGAPEGAGSAGLDVSTGPGTSCVNEPVSPDPWDGVVDGGSGSAGTESEDGREDGAVTAGVVGGVVGGLVAGGVFGLVAGGVLGVLRGGVAGRLVAGGVALGCWVGGSEEGGSAASGDDGGWVGVGVLLAGS